MDSEISAPQKKLSKNAIKVWMISDLISDLIGFIVLTVLFYLDYHFSWLEWIGWILIGLAVLAVLSPIWSIMRPFLLYKNWRYDVDEEFLKLKFGAIFEEHHLVPMTKIQAVSTSQGPIYRKYRLFSVKIETMGSTHTIPALSEEIATELRNKIAYYAKIKEVE
ncbi:PH domain-containing protein [Metabacillus niabensis]|uniref:Membrane protein YdbS with pleckstrin-like domain n=1 Tax=Metabacillus niabensis TaxID=324854 RepID=A0ABT9Z3A8_9BACI|nr:PH domain-containing protein [Metabacillus niabensis]MDQ0226326.1 membrane protein YdbS with pleckstrin-like domain [Metabacillus niabensis]